MWGPSLLSTCGGVMALWINACGQAVGNEGHAKYCTVGIEVRGMLYTQHLLLKWEGICVHSSPALDDKSEGSIRRGELTRSLCFDVSDFSLYSRWEPLSLPLSISISIYLSLSLSLFIYIYIYSELLILYPVHTQYGNIKRPIR